MEACVSDFIPCAQKPGDPITVSKKRSLEVQALCFKHVSSFLQGERMKCARERESNEGLGLAREVADEAHVTLTKTCQFH